MGLATAIPSMFIRRLLLLGLCFGVGLCVVGAQTYRLTVIKGRENLDKAESRLVLEEWTPTIRGRVLDRKGRVLAQDRAGFDVMVWYPVISGEWAYDQATGKARGAAGKAAWARANAATREQWVKAQLPACEADQRKTWSELSRVLGIPEDELAQRRDRIREQVQRTVSTTRLRWLDERREKFGELNARGEELTLRDVDRPVAVEGEYFPIAVGAGDDKLFALRRIEASLPGVKVVESAVRSYPFESMSVSIDRSRFPTPIKDEKPVTVRVDGVATHVLGWMRNLQAEDLDKRPRKNPDTGELDRGLYMDRDKVGAAGIEASAERTLRGLRGVTRLHRDTNEKEVEPSKPGQDVRLSIDVNLQARVQAIMSKGSGMGVLHSWQLAGIAEQRSKLPLGQQLSGAAVVLDVNTGEILAMVSMPSFTREQLAEEPEEVWADKVGTPFVNRAVAKPYPPGSIVKPVILCSAVTEGVHTLSHEIECNGHLYPNSPTKFRCWVYKQFQTTHSEKLGGPLNATDAIMLSCNIYFFTLGRALDVGGVTKWYRAFGVGEAFKLGIGTEWPGSVMKKWPGPGGKIEPPQLADAIFMGIGQGPVDWTPLHAADAYATIARGGTRLVPRINRDAMIQATDLKLNRDAVDAAMLGLYRCVNDLQAGTGSRAAVGDGLTEPMFNHPDLDIRGKTGTAAAPKLYSDEDKDDDGHPDVLREGDHSWFVVMVGPKGRSPRYTIATVMEYAGSGGRVSGPITNQIIWALKDEGYLP